MPPRGHLRNTAKDDRHSAQARANLGSHRHGSSARITPEVLLGQDKRELTL